MPNSSSYIARRRSMTDDQIVALYGELQDADLVAYRAGCSNSTVLALVRKAGQPVAPRGGRPGRRRPLGCPETEIVRLYLAGLTAPEVGARVGCTDSAVYRVLRAHNVPRRRGAVGLRRRYGAQTGSGG
jgi:hypothetical protein